MFHTEILPAGTPAPDFTLVEGTGGTFRLADHRGRPVVLVFYPADWSPVCGDQLSVYAELTGEFDRSNAIVVGISVDSTFCHAAYARTNNLPFPLLSDFEPKGEISRLYNAYNAVEGISERALYVIDRDGIIRWSHWSPKLVNPGADGVLAALDALDDPHGR